MRNFQDFFETRKRSFISAFSICMTVPLMLNSIRELVVGSIHPIYNIDDLSQYIVDGSLYLSHHVISFLSLLLHTFRRFPVKM